METTDIILWVVGGGFTTMFVLMTNIWNSINKKIDKLDDKLNTRIDKLDEKLNTRIDKLDEKLSNRIDKLDEKMTDIDRRLCRLEGAFASKDCCMIKDDRHLRKAE